MLALLINLAVAQAWTPVAPGVESQQWMVGGPNRVSAVRVHLCQPGVRIRATTSTERGKRTSTWASSIGAKAAVNGGFFTSGYTPDGGAAGGGSVWWDASDTTARGWIGFGPRQLLHSGSGAVDWPPPAGIGEVVNGDATLVSGGVAVNCGGCGGGRAPRTAAGYTADRRTLYLVAVDGRTTSSVGMTIDELAALMASLGVDRAMNLDGGGSTTAWTTQGVMNVPSDGSERTVANHLGVLSAGGGLATHCPTGWSATYQDSTFPGGLELTAEVGTVVTGELSLGNDGTNAWDGSTLLAPLPRDQASPLQGTDWVGPHRIAAVDQPTAPGGTGTFSFSVQVPTTPGTTVQQLSLVQEGVTWFGDSWGPADGTLALTVHAVPPPSWRAEWVQEQGWPAPLDALVAAPGEAVEGAIVLKNTGTETWPADVVRLGTTHPRDHASALHDDDTWLASNRVVSTPHDVAPGETVVLPVVLAAPTELGLHQETFGLLAEGITWFADDGGPADDVMTVGLTVVPPDTSSPPDTADADDTGDVDAWERQARDGCGCDGGPGGPPLLGLAMCLPLVRRRRLGAGEGSAASPVRQNVRTRRPRPRGIRL